MTSLESTTHSNGFNSSSSPTSTTSESSPPPPPPPATSDSPPSSSATTSFLDNHAHEDQDDAHPTPLYSPQLLDSVHDQQSASSASASSTRPPPPARGSSFANSNKMHMNLDPFGTDRARRVSYPATSLVAGTEGGIWSTQPPSRTMRAASDGLLLSTGFTAANGFGGASSGSSRSREQSGGGDASSAAQAHAQAAQSEQQERAALFREHERRSLETSAQTRLANSVAAANAREAFASPPLGSPAASSPFFQSTSATTTTAGSTPSAAATSSSNGSSSASLPLPAPPLLSPTLPQESAATPTPNGTSDDRGAAAIAAVARATSASLHLGDLDVWMDEAYVRECCARMGWEGVTNIKMIRGASPSSGYCFLAFPTVAHAAAILARYQASPPTLMPRSGRTFKLNWGTGLPGLQPRWEGEFSVFVGDLGREVGEAELVSLFTPIFPSTKSAKVMCDPSTGLSRGYGFVRFADENDMHRALALGQHAGGGSGLSLHGRTLRISEASGPGNAGGAGGERGRTRSGPGAAGAGAGGEGLSILTSGMGYQQQHQQQQQQQQQLPQHLAYPPHSHPQQQQQQDNGYPDFLSPTFPVPFTPHGPLSPSASANGYTSGGTTSPISPRGPLSPGFGVSNGGGGGGGGGASNHTTDPNNTTVFVGGLPACISEETLKSFFHHFGEITYCKIPTGKGCGFVQFVRRADAELAIAKMNDFPIHGKSRIRLSWGRSQGDKQVEHVRKLASALGVTFESVWRMVQGPAGGSGAPGGMQQQQQQVQQQQQQPQQQQQQPSTVGGSRFESLGVGRMDLGAVASAAGLTEAEVLDLVGGRSPPASSTSGTGGAGSDLFARSSGGQSSAATSFADSQQQQQQHSNGHITPSGGGPYSRVSPSSFSAFSPSSSSSAATSGGGNFPLSPPPSAGGVNGGGSSTFALQQHYQQPLPMHLQQQQQQGGYNLNPYQSIRPDAFPHQQQQHHLASAGGGGGGSPYERVDFAEGGLLHSQGGRSFSPRYGGYEQQQGQEYTHQPQGQGLEESFAHLALSQQQPHHHPASNSPLPPPLGGPSSTWRGQGQAYGQQQQQQEWVDERTPRAQYAGYGGAAGEGEQAGEAQWGGWAVSA